tara:strand:- start:169 stop:507 length:339 start_codon:yes stop_codon:yes gene_type:complete
MKAEIYQLLHVFSIILLTGFTFYAVSNPQKHLKKLLSMITGILAVLALVGGAGLMAKLGYSWGTPWVIVKIVCWLALSAMSGMAFRKSKSVVLSGTILAVGVALYMVYFRPF